MESKGVTQLELGLRMMAQSGSNYASRRKSLASIGLGGRINDEGSGNEDGAKGVDLGDTVPGRAQKASGPHPARGKN